MFVNDFSDELISLALKEDLGDAGDLTSTHFVPESAEGSGQIVARETLRISGAGIAQRVFQRVDPGLAVAIEKEDGTSAEPGDVLLKFSGSLRAILTAERSALNFLQRLSGVATLTQRFVREVEGTEARILDTRKTTPGWRMLEKQAVAHGGGTNHRIGLYDAVMVKDNHLLATPSEELPGMILEFKKLHPDRRVQFEADTLEQVERFLGYQGLDSILLDNMTLEKLSKAVRLRRDWAPDVLLEASGGVNLQTARGIAETGVDFISVGALTHSAKAADVSLELLPAE